MPGPTKPRRLCPRCGAGDDIEQNQPVWPPDWSCRSCGYAIETEEGIPLLAPELANSTSGMDPALFEPLTRWEKDNFWFVPRNRLIIGVLARYFPMAETVMEIGCGNGFVLSAISELKSWRRLVASELHRTALATARSRLSARAEFVQMDARAIPTAEAFDVIGAFDVLEHIDDEKAVLTAMHRALRPGGGIILTVPQHPWLWSGTDEAAHHKRRYRRGELEEKVETAGFRVLLSGSYTTLLLPLMILSRLNRRSNTLRREFEVSPLVNGVLKAVLNLEVTLTLAGFRFPAGGSRNRRRCERRCAGRPNRHPIPSHTRPKCARGWTPSNVGPLALFTVSSMLVMESQCSSRESRGAFNAMSSSFIPLNRPGIVGRELEYIEQALRSDHRHGSGQFTTLCQSWIERWLGRGRVLLTQSCTAALEMAALLVGLKEGDEVIMPSYTFVSTANAFVLRGAVPVFVDIDLATQNISPAEVERAITEKTRAIVAVHYGGIGCDMVALADIASRHDLVLIEDAAQALMAYKTGRPLGSFGALAAFSFHDSKNISSGEGGALIVNDPTMARRAELLWEKGTNRLQFERREVDKYNWLDIGSSFLPSEVTAAFLLAQLEKAEEITRARQKIWVRYQNEFGPVANHARLSNPPADCDPNGHIFYLVLPNRIQRDAFIGGMKARNIATPFHYVPLHSSPAGQKFGRAAKSLPNTEFAGNGLVRLPIFPTLSDAECSHIVASTFATLSEMKALE